MVAKIRTEIAMKSLLIGAAGAALVIISDIYFLGWSGNDQTIRLGVAVAAFLVVTAAASSLTEAPDQNGPLG
jgi:hypothetical protein